jgi:hypothetical protein
LPDLFKHPECNVFCGRFRKFLIFEVTRQSGKFLAGQIMEILADFGTFPVLRFNDFFGSLQYGGKEMC